MQDARFVSGVDSRYDLLHDGGRALQTERALATQQLIERFSFDVLHHQKEDAVGTFSKVSYVDDVWVLDRSSGTRLALKARDRLAFLQVLVVQNVWPNGFHRHPPRHQILILRKIDLAHRSASQTFLKQITT